MEDGMSCEDGEVHPGLDPIELASISGKIACGKRGGPKFIDETVRVDPESGECPRTYVPCSPYTNSTDTICV